MPRQSRLPALAFSTRHLLSNGAPSSTPTLRHPLSRFHLHSPPCPSFCAACFKAPAEYLEPGSHTNWLALEFLLLPLFDMSPRTTRVGDRLPSSMRQSQPNHSDTGGSADSTRSSPSIFPGHCSRLSKSISLSTTRCHNRTDAKQSPASTAHAPACAAFRGRGGAPGENTGEHTDTDPRRLSTASWRVLIAGKMQHKLFLQQDADVLLCLLASWRVLQKKKEGRSRVGV